MSTASAVPVNEAVARVEAELAAFWSVPETHEGEAVAKVRAATMNFVVIAGPGEVDALRADIDALSETHAGRAFVLRIDGRLAPWEAATDVHAVCRIDGGATPVCHDRIEIAFGAVSASRAGSVVASLGLPEVPYVVELGAGAPAPIVDSMLPRSDRIVVDSAHTSLGRIAQVAGAARAPVADRGFVRAYSFRDLVARFFDEAPRAAFDLRRVEVSRAPGGRNDGAALLLGWLGSRLGWRFESRDRAVDAAGGPVSISLRDDGRADVAPGTLTGVRLEAADGGAVLRFSCERTERPGVVRWSASGAHEVSHEHPLGYRDESWVLAKAIDAKEGDRVCREALLAAADWSAK